jgi:hypothetical protein
MIKYGMPSLWVMHKQKQAINASKDDLKCI